MIGKRDGKQVLCILIDLHHGSFDSTFHDSMMVGFKDALQALLVDIISKLTLAQWTMVEQIPSIINRLQWFNCHPYVFGEKGMLENTHWLIRYVIPKDKSHNAYTFENLVILN